MSENTETPKTISVRMVEYYNTMLVKEPVEINVEDYPELNGMTEEEMQETGFQKVGIVIELNDGTIIWPTSDNEGNNSGAIHYAINSDSQKDYVIPNL